jgi:hypothetical protein
MRLTFVSFFFLLTAGCAVNPDQNGPDDGGNGGTTLTPTGNGGSSSDGDPASTSSNRTATVCAHFDRSHSSLSIMLESGVQSRWSGAGTSHGSSWVCGDIMVDGASDDVKLQVRMDGGDTWSEWAAYNNDGVSCVWQPIETTVDGQMVSVRSRPWDFTNGTTPDPDEGCDGWASVDL